MQDKIEIQRKKIVAGNPTIELTDFCQVGNGIVVLTPEEKDDLIAFFEEKTSNLEVLFFIPASGSGSRMFGDLFQLMQNEIKPSEHSTYQKLISNINQLALYQLLTPAIKEKIKKGIDPQELLQALIGPEGLNLDKLPKGLIPFHSYEKFELNPFQEHLWQSKKIESNAAIHFTINTDFQNEVLKSIKALEATQGCQYDYSFSEQNSNSNSIAFDDKNEPVRDNQNQIIQRPGGHGTLINNLNEIEKDIVFIRNIDNVQHSNKAETSVLTRKCLGGALLKFQEAVFNVLKKIERGDAFESSIKALNKQYDLRLNENQLTISHEAYLVLNKPIRIAGMVKNEGAPGGGPFWVTKNGNSSRQIVEKTQISNRPAQLELMSKATHFNPVDLVCGLKDYKGKKFNLTSFVDEDLYFIVSKTQENISIRYIEQPGLWNGAMGDWLTLFYEIESTCFSPVKTVFDLLDPLHQA